MGVPSRKVLILKAFLGSAATLAMAGCTTMGQTTTPRAAFNDTRPDPIASLILNTDGLPQGVSRVAYYGADAPGTIMVDILNHRLYLTQGDGTALSYPVASPKNGVEPPPAFSTITAKRVNPIWTPTETMVQAKPGLRAVAGGDPKNPLGIRALNLGDTLFRIHGTNAPESIGQNASSGCIRMLNDHVVDLFDRVAIGTAVKVYKDGMIPGINMRQPTDTIANLIYTYG